jgi:hypothetical protein
LQQQQQRPQSALPAIFKFLPVEVVLQALLAFGRETKRTRKLPSELVVYLTIAMGLFRHLSISDVLSRVVSALGAKVGFGAAEVPHSTSITRALDRVGWEVMRKIFQLLASRLDLQFSRAQRWRGFLVRALDGSTARTADTAGNEAWFKRPGKRGKGVSAFPQVRFVLVFDVFSRLVCDAVLGPYSWSEVRMAEFLLDRLEAGTLLLLDRAYHSFVWPARLHEKGMVFVMRAKRGEKVPKYKAGEWLGRGDRLCTLLASRPALKRFPSLPRELTVRMITVSRPGFRPLVLLTNLLSKADYPAAEIAHLYRARWEAEQGYREIKAQLGDEHVLFRCHQPDRVLQEAYGLLIAYLCTRALICEAAAEGRVSPLNLSFTKSLERIRRAFATHSECSCIERDLVLEISLCLLQPKRAGRRCAREVKPRPAKYAAKRRGLPTPIGRYDWRKRGRTRDKAPAAETAARISLTG